jgi:hypothetical protein
MTDSYRREVSVAEWIVAIVVLVVQIMFLVGTLVLVTATAGETLEPFLDSTRGLVLYLLVGTFVAYRSLSLAHPVALAKWRFAGVQNRHPIRIWFRLAREALFLTWAGCMIVIVSGLFWPIALLLARRLRQIQRSRLAEADEQDVEELTCAIREEVE